MTQQLMTRAQLRAHIQRAHRRIVALYKRPHMQPRELPHPTNTPRRIEDPQAEARDNAEAERLYLLIYRLSNAEHA